MSGERIEQTLHGYRRGHERMASSVDLDVATRGLMDNLSDLSGYMPSDIVWASYLTGYPCGEHYALARTWPDWSAPRSGAVWTHTLLVPPSLLGRLKDPWSLTHLHHPPESRDDLEVYGRPLSFAEPASAQEPSGIAEPVRRQIAEYFFGLEHRPLILRRERADDATMGWLWSLLWHEPRCELAFCTLALQPRRVQGRVFDVMIVPDKVLGGFSAHLPRQTDIPRTGPWVEALLQEGSALTERLGRWCQARGLAMPHPTQLGTLHRLVQVDDGAGMRLAAARARADLLVLLWPELPATHPTWKEALESLVGHLGQMKGEPSFWWELEDLLGRPQWSSLSTQEDAWGEAQRACLSRSILEQHTLGVGHESDGGDPLHLFLNQRGDEERQRWLRAMVEVAGRAERRLDPIQGLEPWIGALVQSAAARRDLGLLIRLARLTRGRAGWLELRDLLPRDALPKVSLESNQWEDLLVLVGQLARMDWYGVRWWAEALVEACPAEVLAGEEVLRQVEDGLPTEWRKVLLSRVIPAGLSAVANKGLSEAAMVACLQIEEVQAWCASFAEGPTSSTPLRGYPLGAALRVSQRALEGQDERGPWVWALCAWPLREEKVKDWSPWVKTIAYLLRDAIKSRAALSEGLIKAIQRNEAKDADDLLVMVLPVALESTSMTRSRRRDLYEWMIQEWTLRAWSMGPLLFRLHDDKILREEFLEVLSRRWSKGGERFREEALRALEGEGSAWALRSSLVEELRLLRPHKIWPWDG